jgi:hypothetical protein
VVAVFIPVISWSEQATLFLVSVFYHASFRATERILIGIELRTVFRVCRKSPRPNKQLYCRHRSSVMLSFRATEFIFTGTRTKDIFFEVSTFPSFKKQACRVFGILSGNIRKYNVAITSVWDA